MSFQRLNEEIMSDTGQALTDVLQQRKALMQKRMSEGASLCAAYWGLNEKTLSGAVDMTINFNFLDWSLTDEALAERTGLRVTAIAAKRMLRREVY